MEDLKRWSPELIGGLWGWKLTKYKSFANAYRIQDKTLFLLGTNARFIDNVLWNPLTGRGFHLDASEFIKFTRENYTNRYGPGAIPIQLYGNHSLMSVPSPGEISSCDVIFPYYYQILSAPDHVIRSFYVARKIENAVIDYYHNCGDNTPPGYHSINLDWEGFLNYTDHTPLPDGSMVFHSSSTKAFTMVRLDDDGRQHTTMGGTMIVIDAEKINLELDSALSKSTSFDRNNVFRYKIFIKEIRASINRVLR